jgi:hypothetical protein
MWHQVVCRRTSPAVDQVVDAALATVVLCTTLGQGMHLTQAGSPAQPLDGWKAAQLAALATLVDAARTACSSVLVHASPVAGLACLYNACVVWQQAQRCIALVSKGTRRRPVASQL